GAWASTREKEIEKQTLLTSQRHQLQEQLRDVISGSYPLTLARKYVGHVITELTTESENRRLKLTADMLGEHFKSLEIKFSRMFDQSINAQVLDALRVEFSGYM